MTRLTLSPNGYSADAISRSVERCLEVSVIPVIGLIITARCLAGSGTRLGIWMLSISVIYAVVYLLGHSTAGRPRWIDWSLLAVVGAETASYFNSTYRTNSLHGYNEILFLFLFYCFVRLHLKHEYQLVCVLLLIALLGLCLSVTALSSFHRQYAEITAYGFDDVTDFRQFIRAFQTDDSPAGEWITLYLALLAPPVLLFMRPLKRGRAVSWLLWCPVVAILLVISATFSRGLYLATTAFFAAAISLGWLYGLTGLRRLVGLSASALLTLILILCATPLREPALKTVLMFKTTSQVRSLEGRASLWRASWDVFQAHPLLGLGSSNFAMQYAAYKEEGAVYVGRTFNIIQQLLVEKGAVGLLAYCLLIFGFFKASHENLRRGGGHPFRAALTVVFMASGVSLLVRDMSYSSLLTNNGVSTLLCFFFAVNAGAGTSPEAVGGAGRAQPASAVATAFSKKIAGLAPTACAALLYAISYPAYARGQQAERAFTSFGLRFNQGDYSAAQKEIERAVSLSPEDAYYLASRGLLSERLGQRRFDPAAFLEQRLPLSEEQLKGLEVAARFYQQSLELNPLDDGSHHNLAWLHSLLGHKEQSLRGFQRAIAIDGSVALYHISLGLLYEQQGERARAHSEYALAVRLSPGVLDSQFFRDLRHRSPGVAEGVVRESISHLEEQLGRGRSPILKGKLGKIYLHNNMLDKASALLREAVTDLPTLPRPWHNLGDVYGKQGDEAAMLECYRRATFLDGNDALAWSKLGDFHNRHNHPSEAIRSYARAVRGWMNLRSEHAGRVSRIYRAGFAISDDVVPDGFLTYCSPSPDVSKICLELARLYDEVGQAGPSNYYRDLSLKLAP